MAFSETVTIPYQRSFDNGGRWDSATAIALNDAWFQSGSGGLLRLNVRGGAWCWWQGEPNRMHRNDYTMRLVANGVTADYTVTSLSDRGSNVWQISWATGAGHSAFASAAASGTDDCTVTFSSASLPDPTPPPQPAGPRMYVGAREVSKVYIGAREIAAAYLGGTKI